MIDCAFNWGEVCHTVGPYIRPGGSDLTEKALEICKLSPGSYIADIGCGTGGTLEHLRRTGLYRTVGLDYSDALIGETLSRLTAEHLVRGRAEILPFKENSFDALFCECVLSILNDEVAALYEYSRVLKEGGFLIISDLFHQNGPEQRQEDIESQKRLPTKEDLLSLLERLSFSLLLWEEHERFFKEFVARMILAGAHLPDVWGYRQRQKRKKPGRSGISYFLLVARKLVGPA
jgi:arsenite methyltransferase